MQGAACPLRISPGMNKCTNFVNWKLENKPKREPGGAPNIFFYKSLTRYLLYSNTAISTVRLTSQNAWAEIIEPIEITERSVIPEGAETTEPSTSIEGIETTEWKETFSLQPYATIYIICANICQLFVISKWSKFFHPFQLKIFPTILTPKRISPPPHPLPRPHFDW
jgi:hypothetical protein